MGPTRLDRLLGARFDPGTKIAVLHGNPGAKGDYTLSLQFPDGYKFPVHWHPGGEHLTVLSGTFMLGMGNTADWNTVRTYAPGDFIYVPARHPHFGGARGLTVIQLHGEGPFQPSWVAQSRGPPNKGFAADTRSMGRSSVSRPHRGRDFRVSSCSGPQWCPLWCPFRCAKCSRKCAKSS